MQVHLQDTFRALGFAIDSQILAHGISVEAADTHIHGAPMQSHPHLRLCAWTGMVRRTSLSC